MSNYMIYPDGKWPNSFYEITDFFDAVFAAVERGESFKVAGFNLPSGPNEWVNIEEAFPNIARTAEDGLVWCHKCLDWVPSHTDEINQKWGIVYRTLCPEGHILESSHTVGAFSAKILARGHAPETSGVNHRDDEQGDDGLTPSREFGFR